MKINTGTRSLIHSLALTTKVHKQTSQRTNHHRQFLFIYTVDYIWFDAPLPMLIKKLMILWIVKKTNRLKILSYFRFFIFYFDVKCFLCLTDAQCWARRHEHNVKSTHLKWSIAFLHTYQWNVTSHESYVSFHLSFVFPSIFHVSFDLFTN